MASEQIHTISHGGSADLNTALIRGFSKHSQNMQIRRSHFFNGRYENIYITVNEIPELESLLRQASEIAASICNVHKLKAGCWFNAMPPGAITTRHNHDDNNELLSAVYYVHVPADSGELILYDTEQNTRITPVAGQLILFPPNIDHEVTRNNSDEERLSIGINFGPADED